MAYGWKIQTGCKAKKAKQKIKYFWVFWFIDLKIKDCKIVDRKLI